MRMRESNERDAAVGINADRHFRRQAHWPARATHARAYVLLATSLLLTMPALARAAVTQDEALSAIRSNMGKQVDVAMLGWLALGVFLLVMLIVWLGKRRVASQTPPALNHKGKLVRELTRSAGLKSAELKRVRAMADQLKKKHGIEVENPMVLLLCPSLLAKAMKKER